MNFKTIDLYRIPKCKMLKRKKIIIMKNWDDFLKNCFIVASQHFGMSVKRERGDEKWRNAVDSQRNLHENCSLDHMYIMENISSAQFDSFISRVVIIPTHEWRKTWAALKKDHTLTKFIYFIIFFLSIQIEIKIPKERKSDMGCDANEKYFLSLPLYFFCYVWREPN